MSDSGEARMPDDGALLFRLSKGDEPAFRMLHDRHQAPVFRMSLVLMGTTRDAEEVAATAFFELWRRRDRVRVVGGSVLPWLLATTTSAAKSSLRSRRRYRRLLARIPHGGDLLDRTDEVEQAMEAMNVSRPVRVALHELGQRDASILILCIVQDLSTSEIAVVLGVPEVTVESRLSRLRARLGGDLDEHATRAEEANV